MALAESRVCIGWTGPFRVGDPVILTSGGNVKSGVVELISEEGLWLIDPKYSSMENYQGGIWIPKWTVSAISTNGWSVNPSTTH